MVFPFRPLCQDSGDLAGWRPVGKRRRISRFSLADGPAAGHAPGLGHKPRCEVELTEVRTNGQDWWTLGFEATGRGRARDARLVQRPGDPARECPASR